MTVAEWCRYWLNEIDSRNVRPSTWNAHRYLLENHIVKDLGEIPMETLNRETVADFLSRKQEKYRPTTCRNIYKVLHQCMGCAVGQQFITANPADGLNIPWKAQCCSNVPSDFQIEEYLDTAETMGFRTLFQLMAEAGLRPKEVCTLRWNDLNLRRKTLTVDALRGLEKMRVVDYPGNQIRKLRLSDEMIALLKAEHRKHPHDELMFVQPCYRKPYTPKMLRLRHSRIIALADIPEFDLRAFHDSYAIRQYRQEKSAKEVAELIGKTRARDARRYYKNAVEQAKGVDCPEEIRDKQKQTAELMGSLLDWM